jgi:hypothetical protein
VAPGFHDNAKVVNGFSDLIVEVPGAELPEHRHVNEQFGMVIEGSVVFRVGNESRTVEPGRWRTAGISADSVAAHTGRLTTTELAGHQSVACASVPECPPRRRGQCCALSIISVTIR